MEGTFILLSGLSGLHVCLFQFHSDALNVKRSSGSCLLCLCLLSADSKTAGLFTRKEKNYSECLQVNTLTLYSLPWRPTKGMRNLLVTVPHLCRIFCCCLLHFGSVPQNRSIKVKHSLRYFRFCFTSVFFPA